MQRLAKRDTSGVQQGDKLARTGVSATAALTTAGLRATAPRVQLLQFFRGAERRHLSAEQVYMLLRDGHAQMALATVYRVLSQLADVGLLSRNVFATGVAVYELQPDTPHDHLICLACKRVDEFASDALEREKVAVATAGGYVLAARAIALYGECADCRARGGPRTGR